MAIANRIAVGDMVYTRRGDRFVPHRVTQAINNNGATMLILDSGRFASSISANALEERDGEWFEKDRR